MPTLTPQAANHSESHDLDKSTLENRQKNIKNISETELRHEIKRREDRKNKQEAQRQMLESHRKTAENENTIALKAGLQKRRREVTGNTYTESQSERVAKMAEVGEQQKPGFVKRLAARFKKLTTPYTNPENSEKMPGVNLSSAGVVNRPAQTNTITQDDIKAPQFVPSHAEIQAARQKIMGTHAVDQATKTSNSQKELEGIQPGIVKAARKTLEEKLTDDELITAQLQIQEAGNDAIIPEDRKQTLKKAAEIQEKALNSINANNANNANNAKQSHSTETEKTSEAAMIAIMYLQIQTTFIQSYTLRHLMLTQTSMMILEVQRITLISTQTTNAFLVMQQDKIKEQNGYNRKLPSATSSSMLFTTLKEQTAVTEKVEEKIVTSSYRIKC